MDMFLLLSHQVLCPKLAHKRVTRKIFIEKKLKKIKISTATKFVLMSYVCKITLDKHHTALELVGDSLILEKVESFNRKIKFASKLFQKQPLRQSGLAPYTNEFDHIQRKIHQRALILYIILLLGAKQAGFLFLMILSVAIRVA